MEHRLSPVCSSSSVQYADVESNDAVSECFRKLFNANISMALEENAAAIMCLWILNAGAPDDNLFHGSKYWSLCQSHLFCS